MKLLKLVAIFLPLNAVLLVFSFSFLFTHPPAFRPMDLPSPFHTETVSEVLAITAAPPTPAMPGEDIRAFSLRSFLMSYRSPLVNEVDELIRQADLYGLDYALIPAIAMQESGLCKDIPEESHNCWGFGIYGGKVARFPSYSQAIAKVAKTIKESYIKKGLTNATLVEDRWTPSSEGNWSYSVNYYIGKIHEYEQKSP